MNSSNQKLVSLRTALILLLGALTGVGAGVLTVAAGGVWAAGFLSGGAAFAGAVIFFHTIID
ncbi:hypothetical protein [Streptomyces sp. NBC_01794]|uniref:hypothetical protein n=1 Tax=Streptomyces sp. NBC_01794 TaxID=2975942 RepID=UPI00308A5E4B|nr:hypothetical protein OIE54_41465 [Streptomyces sp. NBC_01794]